MTDQEIVQLLQTVVLQKSKSLVEILRSSIIFSFDHRTTEQLLIEDQLNLQSIKQRLKKRTRARDKNIKGGYMKSPTIPQALDDLEVMVEMYERLLDTELRKSSQ